MSVTVQQILGLLQAVAPPALALDWDNVGLLVDAGTPVDSVLTTLDITPAVVREAVENDCQPLPDEALGKVWESFYRADESRTGGGTGLGLAIAKSIIELHGGSCGVKNTKTGVEFSFEI